MRIIIILAIYNREMFGNQQNQSGQGSDNNDKNPNEQQKSSNNAFGSLFSGTQAFTFPGATNPSKSDSKGSSIFGGGLGNKLFG